MVTVQVELSEMSYIYTMESQYKARIHDVCYMDGRSPFGVLLNDYQTEGAYHGQQGLLD